MGCDAMIDIIERFIDNEMSEFAHRNIQKAINDDRRIDTFGLEFITTPAIKVAFDNFKYAIHRHRDELIERCEQEQRQENVDKNAPTLEKRNWMSELR